MKIKEFYKYKYFIIEKFHKYGYFRILKINKYICLIVKRFGDI